MDINRDNDTPDKIGRMFYNMLGTISMDIIKSNKFPEDIKKYMFQYSVISYDELDKITQEQYKTAGFSALQSGIDMFNFLSIGQEDK